MTIRGRGQEVCPPVCNGVNELEQTTSGTECVKKVRRVNCVVLREYREAERLTRKFCAWIVALIKFTFL